MCAESRTSREQDALRAAQLYYLQDLTMDAIASEMHVSRSSVSRLLSRARETGLVEITVRSSHESGSRVQRRIAEEYGVNVHLVPTPSGASEVDRLERTAKSAARILASYVDLNMTIGVAWGATLSAVGRHLPEKRTHYTSVVQMNGAANVRTTGIPYTNEILARFGSAFNADVHHFPVPALFDSPETKQAMWRERSVARIVEMQRSVDLFAFGLGASRAGVPSHVYAGGYFDAADLEELQRERIVGDCATLFYRIDGSTEGITLNQRSSGPDPEAVRAIPKRVCVVSGVSKLASLRGALAAGLITELVIDETVARRLLA
ncbi:sugar-binding transcriptional regulator [Leucobacter luti]|uniref:sugar-binding transcriptional regulator n=1 Tax=Leucobacter luti TaxID=340320 RepID=UPI003D0846C7